MPEATNRLNSPYHLAVSTFTNEVECNLNEKGSGRDDRMFSAPRLESNEGDLSLASLSQPNCLEKQKQRCNSREKIEPKMNKGNYHGRDPIATCEMASKSRNKFHKSSDCEKLYRPSESSTLNSPPGVEGRVRKSIKLLGTPVKIQPDTNLELKGSKSESTQSYKPGSLSERFDQNHIGLSQEPTTKRASKILGMTPDSPLHPKTYISQEELNHSDQFSIQGDSSREYRPQGMKFDENIFILTPLSQRDKDEVLRILNLISYDLKMVELVMTEEQFIKYCPVLYRNSEKNNNPSENLESAAQERQRQSEESLEILMNNLELWYNHWNKKANLKFTKFPQNVNAKLKSVIVTYLFYIDMISTIVPVETEKFSAVSELEKGFLYAEKLFGSGKFLKEIKKTETYEQVQKIKKKAKNSRGCRDIFTGSWILIMMWMEGYRKNLFNLIIEHDLGEATKRFFNRIFYHSIENLNKRLKPIH
jgi:hypothetical protein